MSKESTARERNTCPKCFVEFTFLEYHLPHCKGTGLRPAKKKIVVDETLRPKIEDHTAKKNAAVAKPRRAVAVTAAVDAKTTQGAVRDERLRTKRKGSTTTSAKSKGGRA